MLIKIGDKPSTDLVLYVSNSCGSCATIHAAIDSPPDTLDMRATVGSQDIVQLVESLCRLVVLDDKLSNRFPFSESEQEKECETSQK
jgi:hypothetical protein